MQTPIQQRLLRYLHSAGNKIWTPSTLTFVASVVFCDRVTPLTARISRARTSPNSPRREKSRWDKFAWLHWKLHLTLVALDSTGANMSRFVCRIVAVASQHATARAAELPRRIPGIIRPVSTSQGTVSELLIYISAVLELQLPAPAPSCTDVYY